MNHLKKRLPVLFPAIAVLMLFCSSPCTAFAQVTITLDVDGNGLADGGTDGMLLNRYLFGFRGDNLISDVVDTVNCTRCTAEAIEKYLITLITPTADTEIFTNSLGMTFRRIPAGSFKMGSPESEAGRDPNEILHQVTLTKPFYMQTTEVTQGQWKAVMGENPSYFSECGDNCPVEQVSWDDIQEFITELNNMGEGTYRLPTEAEWEYAARAGTDTAFTNGGITETGCGYDPNLDAVGWYCGNSDNKTHPVAQKQANTWGLYDMHGNVWEWCQDWYGNYPSSAVIDPTGPDSGSLRVVRSSSWSSHARYCRSASRRRDWPGSRYAHYSFRLVLTPDQ